MKKDSSHVCANAQIDFSTFDLEGILRRVRNGTNSPEDLEVLASFCGTYLRHWQDIKELIDRGIIKKI